MQKKILKNKNRIMIAGGILIAFAFLMHFGFKNETAAEIAFIIASVLGILPIFIQAMGALKVKVISIDLLVTIAVMGAFIIRNFEESAIVTFLFLFGSYLEQRTLNKTRSAIKELTEMAPETALKEVSPDNFEEVDVDDVNMGDILLVKTGARVPVDGVVVTGEGSINEASITGESMPVSKEKGSKVFAGTILENGTLRIETEKVGEDTIFGKIIELVEEAQDSKSEAERFIDSFAKYYTPLVLAIALIVYLITRNVELAVTILVLGCPGALVIGVPVSNVAGIGNGAKNGILLKGSEVIKDFSNVDTMILDKTGTLTEGNTRVSRELFYGKEEDKKLIHNILGSVEFESDHPLAKAILNHLCDFDKVVIKENNVIKGGGIKAKALNHRIAIGNRALMEKEGIAIEENVLKELDQLEKEGNSLVITALDNRIYSVIGIKDQIRKGVKENLEKLKKLGVKNLILLSGDNQGTVDLVASELGLTEAHGHLLPEYKAEFVKKRMKNNEIVAFIGDGINDSPSLALANIGIAMGSGTDVAIETSDVVLMNSDFSKLPHALGLVKATKRNMITNIVIAVGVVLILLASLLFTDFMNMSIGMLVHEGSILAVILNGMRLINYKNRK